MKTRLNCIFLLLFLTTGLLRESVQAGEESFRIMLFSGSVFLLDKQQRRIPASIGLQIRQDRYKQIELSPGSTVYLQKGQGQRLLQIEKSGLLEIADIEKRSGSVFSNALAFLVALSKPRSYTKQVKSRGDPPGNDSHYFDRIWEEIALADASRIPTVPPEDTLAAAAWYHQQGNAARTAYLLEHLDNTSRPQNAFFHQLRNDSLRGVPLSGINSEIEQTRRAADTRQHTFTYKALLIGVDDYDHPAWQPLDNPVADIRSIRRLLIGMYRFRPEDIVTLENPNFSDIIDSFHHLKKSVDRRTRLVIYFAGHGYYPADEEEGYWIPKNGGDPTTQRFFIPTSIILSKMKAIKSQHTLLITDSCFSGSLIRKSRGGVVDSGFYRELSEKRSRQIITSGGLEPVSDSGGGDHSVFAGNLLQILSENRNTPLSASELAIELRKSLKNAGARQTPEYGRLYTADDENGEFFFVRKNQSLAFAQKQPEPSSTLYRDQSEKDELDIIGMRNPPANDGSAFQARDNENWWSIAPFVHIGFLEYNYLLSEAGKEPQTISISSSLEGSGLKATYRRTDQKGGFGVGIGLGQFARIKTCADTNSSLSGIGIRTCDEENDSGNESKSSLSGYFNHFHLFADYSVLVWREISVQLGGAVQVQYYQLNNFLEEASLNSTSLGACGKGGATYRKSGWAARFFLDFCLTTFDFSGSLHELDEDHARDVRLLGGMNIGLEAGFQF